MKNLILLLTTFCFCQLSAQTTEEKAIPNPAKPTFSLSLSGGWSVNYMPVNPAPVLESGTYKARAEQAFFAGVSTRQSLCEHFAVKADVLLAVKGYGQQRTTFTPIPEHYQVTYLDFVPQVEYKVGKKFYFSLGGYGGLRLAERLKYSDQTWVHPKALALAQKTDWGLATGVRAEFGRISALIKYQHGLSPAMKLFVTDKEGNDVPAKRHNRNLQVGLGFRLL